MNNIAPTVHNTSPDGTPKAYMVWTLFDNEFNLVKSSSGMIKIPNTPDTRQDIVKSDIIMDRGGYFYAYLVNESSMNVYFDDFQVTHTTGKVLEENHYYPFGMLNAQLSTQPTDKPLNYYKYNGKELQKELNLEWLDYGARFYDAQVGRWHSVDPKAEIALEWTPYRTFFDNPLRYIDPNGHFELDKATEKKYPELASYLKKIASNFDKQSENFKNAFYEASGLNAKQTKQMLTYGKGPKIEVSNLDEVADSNGNGTFDKINGQNVSASDEKGNLKPSNNGKGLIRLDDDVVGMLENSKTMGEKQIGSIMVESTTFHEFTHYGNNIVNGNANGKYKESGKAFEEKAYGQDIGRSNVTKYWESLQLKTLSPVISPIKIK